MDLGMKSGSSGRMSEIFENMVEIPNTTAKKKIKKSIYKEQRGELNGIPTHRYPIYVDNLNGANDVPMVQECIHFTAVKQGGISFQEDADYSAAVAQTEQQKYRQDNTGNFKPAWLKDVSGSHTDPLIKTQQMQAAQTAAKKEKDGERGFLEKVADNAKAAGSYVMNEARRSMKAMSQPSENQEHCFLYMPASIQFNEGAAWGAEGLGALGNMLRQGLRGEGDTGEIIKNFAGGSITKIAQAVALGVGAKAAGVVGALGIASLFDGVGGGLRAAGRFTENPYEEQLFNGIGFREFSFEFAFAPASEAEGDEVDAIIDMFRYHSRPNFVGGWLGEGLYTFPNEFQIDFLMNENGAFEDHPYLPGIHNCVCTNVSTNYTPEGFWTALRDGRPVSYGLSLSFTETKKITQDDIAEGY